MDQLIGQMLNTQDREETIYDDFIDAFVPDNSLPGVIVRKLILGFPVRAFVIRLQKRAGSAG